MIEKPAVIVTSLGRTGTKFFYALFRELIPGGLSLHEPDVLSFNVLSDRDVLSQIRFVLRQLEDAGIYNLIIRRTLRKWSLMELSDARVRGELSYAEAVKQVLDQRRGFVLSRTGLVYIEANAGYYGLIGVLKDVYAHHRVAYLVRDGRDWVRSHLNWGEMYGKGKIRRLVAHTWPTALEIRGDPYAEKWRMMSRFERICWAWTRLNGYALKSIQRNPDAEVFRFEDVFKSESRYQHLAELVDFATDMPGVEPVPPRALEGWLDRKIHESSGKFPAWPEWPSQHRGKFLEICGELMETLHYELD
ncbi:MAG: hypothetical protein ACOC6F_03170 [bacterium]